MTPAENAQATQKTGSVTSSAKKDAATAANTASAIRLLRELYERISAASSVLRSSR